MAEWKDAEGRMLRTGSLGLKWKMEGGRFGVGSWKLRG
jgi:hypothetical protein